MNNRIAKVFYKLIREFLAFLLDAVHEDVNLGQRQTIQEKEEDENLPDPVAAEKSWTRYTMTNWSIIVDMFQGQLKSMLRCFTCGKVSVNFTTDFHYF